MHAFWSAAFIKDGSTSFIEGVSHDYDVVNVYRCLTWRNVAAYYFRKLNHHFSQFLCLVLGCILMQSFA